jgi:SPP1 family predicted phage head-tail adaptor
MSPAATPYISSGQRLHQGLFQKPGPPVPDGTGWVESWIDLPPAEFARITPATQASLEKITAGTTLSMATHILTIPYRIDLTTKVRFVYDGRNLSVLGIFDYEERHVQLNLVCAEVVA